MYDAVDLTSRFLLRFPQRSQVVRLYLALLRSAGSTLVFVCVVVR